nr:MAG TPA: hypothetical protein [Caudoviricetes sp.]
MPIKFILLSCMVCLCAMTYVYIPHLLNTPYNANKSIFVYLHGIFTSIYTYFLTHMHNKQ